MSHLRSCPIGAKRPLCQILTHCIERPTPGTSILLGILPEDAHGTNLEDIEIARGGSASRSIVPAGFESSRKQGDTHACQTINAKRDLGRQIFDEGLVYALVSGFGRDRKSVV